MRLLDCLRAAAASLPFLYSAAQAQTLDEAKTAIVELYAQQSQCEYKEDGERRLLSGFYVTRPGDHAWGPYYLLVNVIVQGPLRGGSWDVGSQSTTYLPLQQIESWEPREVDGNPAILISCTKGYSCIAENGFNKVPKFLWRMCGREQRDRILNAARYATQVVPKQALKF